MFESEKCKELQERYLAAMHAMQTGVAMLLSADPDLADCTPKHLRVGVNSAMVDGAALAILLVKKGIIAIAVIVCLLYVLQVLGVMGDVNAIKVGHG